VTNAFTPPQIEALSSLASILGDTKWVLIGASAIRCRLSLQRRTFDLDFAVGASTASVEPELLNAGWTRDPRTVQRWVRSGATVDLVHATQDDIDEGVWFPLEGVELTVAGFDLAYEELDWIDIGDSMQVLLEHTCKLDKPKGKSTASVPQGVNEERRHPRRYVMGSSPYRHPSLTRAGFAEAIGLRGVTLGGATRHRGEKHRGMNKKGWA
jgi:hypothetical protein